MTTELNDSLNALLADYMVFYQKLRNYHWNVAGSEFFKLHEKFEEAYNEASNIVDGLAERILALDGHAYSTLQDFVDNADLNEDPEVPSAEHMVENLVDDIELLNDRVLEAVELAEQHGDRATANLLDDVIDAQEERLWMFKTFLRK